MARIPQQFINELLARTNIVELVGHRLSLKKRGNNYFSRCPFHNEKSASFSVHENKQIYYCFGCKASGNAIGFLMEHDGMTFIEAIETLATKLGMTVPSQAHNLPSDYQAMIDTMQQAASFYQAQLKKHPNATEYLNNRGLNQDIIDHYSIGFAPPGWDNLYKRLGSSSEQKKRLAKTGMLITKDNGNQYDRFRNRIMFPIRNNRGQVIAFGGRTICNEDPKYLNSPETELFHKRSELYGLFEARQANRKLDRVLIVEGYMDVIALAQLGVSYAVATLGTASTTRHIHSLLRYTSELVFCFDGDTAGEQAAWHTVEMLLPIMRDNISIKFMTLPKGEDPDSLIRSIGKEAFEAEISIASTFTEVFFNKFFNSDIESMDNKAQAAQKIMTLIQKMPTGILQSMMVDKLAETVHMDVSKLNDMLLEHKATAPAIAQPEPPSAPRAPRPKLLDLIEKIISLLLQNPQLAGTINERSSLKNITLPGSDLLQHVLNQCWEHPEINSAALLSLWQQNPDQQMLTELALKEHLVNQELWEKEFVDCWQRLLHLNEEQELSQLMDLAKQQKLDKNGKQRLMELLKN